MISLADAPAARAQARPRVVVRSVFMLVWVDLKIACLRSGSEERLHWNRICWESTDKFESCRRVTHLLNGEVTNEALGSGPQEAGVLNGRKSATIPNLGVLADFQPADRFVVQAPRPPTHAALRSAWVSDLGSVVSAFQAGRLVVWGHENVIGCIPKIRLRARKKTTRTLLRF